MAADSPNRWNLLRKLSRCAYRQAQAANNVSGSTPIPANATVTRTSILEGIQAGTPCLLVCGADLSDWHWLAAFTVVAAG
jgi:hypothetical protein